MKTELSKNQITRYSRQLILSTWSEKKQLQLAEQKILIDTRFPSAAYYLVAAGAKNIVLKGEDAQELGTELKELDPELSFSIYKENNDNEDLYRLEIKEDVDNPLLTQS